MSEQEEPLYDDAGELVGFRYGSIYYGPAEKIKMLEVDLHHLRAHNENLEARVRELRAANSKMREMLNEAGTLNELARRQWEWVDGMGWHNKEPLEYVALIASEIGELANECRKLDGLGLNAGEEMADVILRVIDMAYHYDIDIGFQVTEKINKNAYLEKHPNGRVK